MDRETVRELCAQLFDDGAAFQRALDCGERGLLPPEDVVSGATDAIFSAMPAPVVDRAKVRALVESVMSPDYLGSEELDQTTDYICASFTTRDEVEREVLEGLRAKAQRLTERDPKYDVALGMIEVELASPVQPDESDMAWAEKQLRSHKGSAS